MSLHQRAGKVYHHPAGPNRNRSRGTIMADSALSQAPAGERSEFHGVLATYYRRRADTLSCPPGVEQALHHLTNVEDDAFAALMAERPRTLTGLAEKFDAVLGHANGACGGDLDILHAEQLLRDLCRLLAA
jgi:hypothetical protein